MYFYSYFYSSIILTNSNKIFARSLFSEKSLCETADLCRRITFIPKRYSEFEE